MAKTKSTGIRGKFVILPSARRASASEICRVYLGTTPEAIAKEILTNPDKWKHILADESEEVE